jgi:hypothetical protein
MVYPADRDMSIGPSGRGIRPGQLRDTTDRTHRRADCDRGASRGRLRDRHPLTSSGRQRLPRPVSAALTRPGA